MASKIRLGCIGLAGLLCFVSSASAELTANQTLAQIGDPAVMLYVSGLANGFAWANTRLNQRNISPLYCSPDRLDITPEQYIDILRRYVKSQPAVGEVAIGAALLGALHYTFPC